MNPHTLELIERAKARHAQLMLDRAAKVASVNSASPEGARLSTDSNSVNDSVSVPVVPTVNTIPTVVSQPPATLTFSKPTNLTFDNDQAAALESGLRGKSFVLIGAAGTGKTTVTQELIKQLQQAAHMLPFNDSSKYITAGEPGFVVVGFTNKAVNNIRKKLPPHLQHHCLTIHKLIEFAPEYFQVVDDKGELKNTMRFVPSRNSANPLPHISTIIFEESSMIGTDLYGQLLDALPRPSATQFIFLGDIFQLPPVFGHSILGFKMAELPVIELKTIYRQALLSPIISLATAIRTNGFNPWHAEQQDGNSKLTANVTVDNGEHGKVLLNPWKKRIGIAPALKTFTTFITNKIKDGTYDLEQDQILCPFNVGFGCIEINNHIADYLAKTRNATVFEVLARYQKSYWAVGDNVVFDKQPAIIRNIYKTIGYYGKKTKPASTTLDRWGKDPVNDHIHKSASELLDDLETAPVEDEDSKNLASHTIVLYFPDLDEERQINTAGDINSMVFSYCLTVHKSQGSEWRKVYLILHHSHQTMCSRELLYTAVTRAKQELIVICEGDLAPYKNQLLTGSSRSVIPGTTLQEKIEFFNSKRSAMTNSDN